MKVFTFSSFFFAGGVEMYLCIVGVFCIINYYFKCVYRIRCRFLYI